MPKLSCPCGFVHNLSPIPDEGWITIRDQEYERVIQAEIEREQLAMQKDDDKQGKKVQLTQAIVTAWGRMYECPQCGRIMWQKENSNEFAIYLPERNDLR